MIGSPGAGPVGLDDRFAVDSVPFCLADAVSLYKIQGMSQSLGWSESCFGVSGGDGGVSSLSALWSSGAYTLPIALRVADTDGRLRFRRGILCVEDFTTY